MGNSTVKSTCNSLKLVETLAKLRPMEDARFPRGLKLDSRSKVLCYMQVEAWASCHLMFSKQKLKNGFLWLLVRNYKSNSKK